MKEIHDWVDEKLAKGFGTVSEPLKISHTFKKQAGWIHYAELTIEIIPNNEFKLEIESNLDDEQFHNPIKNALFGFLMNRSYQPLLNIHVRVYDIKSDPVGSSYMAFYAATRQALEKMFVVKC